MDTTAHPDYLHKLLDNVAYHSRISDLLCDVDDDSGRRTYITAVGDMHYAIAQGNITTVDGPHGLVAQIYNMTESSFEEVLSAVIDAMHLEHKRLTK